MTIFGVSMQQVKICNWYRQ